MLKRAIVSLSLGLLTAIPAHALTLPWPVNLPGSSSDDSGTETINTIIHYTTPSTGTITPSGVTSAPAPTVVPVDVLTGIDLDLLAPMVDANLNLNVNANANTNVNVPIRIPWPTGTPAPAVDGNTGAESEAVGPESPAGSGEAVGPESASEAALGTWLAAAATMTEPAQLSVFAQAIADADPNVQGISVDGTVLEFRYRQPAKLLWLIPTHFTLTVRRDLQEDGTSYQYPWWLGISSHNVGTINDAISAQLEQLKAVNSNNALERMAQVMAIVESILHKTAAEVGAVVVSVK